VILPTVAPPTHLVLVLARILQVTQQLSKAITLEGLYVDLGTAPSIIAQHSAPPTPPLSPRRRRSSSSQCSSDGQGHRSEEDDSGVTESEGEPPVAGRTTSRSSGGAFLHGPGSQGISMRVEVDMGWGGGGGPGPQGAVNEGDHQQQQMLPTSVGVRVFLGPVAVTLEDAQQACLAAVVYALQGQQPSQQSHRKRKVCGQNFGGAGRGLCGIDATRCSMLQMSL
jgi:hypothetical protein